MPTTKLIVALSGGMDSTTALANAISCYPSAEILTAGFRYGSKHNTLELQAARRVADHYKVPFKEFDLRPVFQGFNSKLMAGGGMLPHGHYEEESMRDTVVPGRNIIFAAVLAGYAMSEKVNQVWLGIHAGDHYIYPDCRPDFYDAMNSAIRYGTGWEVWLVAPYLKQTKLDILRHGFGMTVPYHLTRTCYSYDEVACGKCGSCQERLEAFKLLGYEDPLPYQSRELLPKKSA